MSLQRNTLRANHIQALNHELNMLQKQYKEIVDKQKELIDEREKYENNTPILLNSLSDVNANVNNAGLQINIILNDSLYLQRTNWSPLPENSSNTVQNIIFNEQKLSVESIEISVSKSKNSLSYTFTLRSVFRYTVINNNKQTEESTDKIVLTVNNVPSGFDCYPIDSGENLRHALISPNLCNSNECLFVRGNYTENVGWTLTVSQDVILTDNTFLHFQAKPKADSSMPYFKIEGKDDSTSEKCEIPILAWVA